MWDFSYRRRLARTRSGERLSRDIEISKKSLRRQATKNGKNGNRSQLHHSIPRFTRQPWHTTTCSSSLEGFLALRNRRSSLLEQSWHQTFCQISGLRRTRMPKGAKRL